MDYGLLIGISLERGAELAAGVVSFPVAPQIERFTEVPGAKLNEMT